MKNYNGNVDVSREENLNIIDNRTPQYSNIFVVQIIKKSFS